MLIIMIIIRISYAFYLMIQQNYSELMWKSTFYYANLLGISHNNTLQRFTLIDVIRLHDLNHISIE